MKSYFTLLLVQFFNGILLAQDIPSDDFIINSTIKIESLEKSLKNGKEIFYKSSGTGFFFIFKNKGEEIPVIVTNKHVIKDALKGILFFKLKLETSLPDYSKIEKVEINNFKDKWLYHPDSSVDLAILPIKSIISYYSNLNKNLYYAGYTEDNIPNDSIENTIAAIENILMIGYPFGLRDTKNNLPIVRNGLTATPPYLNYNSLPEFLIDMPVYSGSSGSPVVIYNPMGYTIKGGGQYSRMRILLLGINYATYNKDFKGKIIPKPSYNIEDSLIVTTTIPYNIGIVIKSKRLLDFKQTVLIKK